MTVFTEHSESPLHPFFMKQLLFSKNNPSVATVAWMTESLHRRTEQMSFYLQLLSHQVSRVNVNTVAEPSRSALNCPRLAAAVSIRLYGGVFIMLLHYSCKV